MIQYLSIIAGVFFAILAGIAAWENANESLRQMARVPMARAHRPRLLGRS